MPGCAYSALPLWSRSVRQRAQVSEAATGKNQSSGFKGVGKLYGFVLNNCRRNGAAPEVELGVKLQAHPSMEFLCCCELSKKSPRLTPSCVFKDFSMLYIPTKFLFKYFFSCRAGNCSMNCNPKYEVRCVVCTAMSLACERSTPEDDGQESNIYGSVLPLPNIKLYKAEVTWYKSQYSKMGMKANSGSVFFTLFFLWLWSLGLIPWINCLL